MRGTREGSSSRTQAWAAECSTLAEAVISAGRSSANRVFRKITSCKILSFDHTSLTAKELSLAPVVLLSHSFFFFSILFLDTLLYFFLFSYSIITDLLSSELNSFFFFTSNHFYNLNMKLPFLPSAV